MVTVTVGPVTVTVEVEVMTVPDIFTVVVDVATVPDIVTVVVDVTTVPETVIVVVDVVTLVETPIVVGVAVQAEFDRVTVAVIVEAPLHEEMGQVRKEVAEDEEADEEVCDDEEEEEEEADKECDEEVVDDNEAWNEDVADADVRRLEAVIWAFGAEAGTDVEDCKRQEQTELSSAGRDNQVANGEGRPAIDVCVVLRKSEHKGLATVLIASAICNASSVVLNCRKRTIEYSLAKSLDLPCDSECVGHNRKGRYRGKESFHHDVNLGKIEYPWIFKEVKAIWFFNRQIELLCVESRETQCTRERSAG